jgi:hypothetical protein
MDRERIQLVTELLEKKSRELMSHEGKDHATIGVNWENIEEYIIEGRIFYVVKTNTFKHIIEGYYLTAHKRFPERFGTGNAVDVIEALRQLEPLSSFIRDFTRYAKFLMDEQFALVFEVIDNAVSSKVLRIDLFRKFTHNGGIYEFTGGIMHAFKHFSIEGRNLSTGKDTNEIGHPERVLLLAIKGFFFNQIVPGRPDTWVATIEIDARHRLKFFFYLEKVTNTYFIDTVYLTSK